MLIGLQDFVVKGLFDIALAESEVFNPNLDGDRDSPPMKWSTVKFSKMEDQDGFETTQARGNCHEVTTG